MNRERYINSFHEKRSQEGYKMRIAFAHSYAFLLRKRVREGQTVLGIQKLAASTAGFGKTYFSEQIRDRTLRQVSSRLLKEQIVKDELEKLGLEYNQLKKQWHDPKLSPGPR